MRYIVDIEGNNLMGPGLDYSAMPYKLKEDYRVWCIVIRGLDDASLVSLYGKTLTKEHLQKALANCTELIGHNIIGFDLPVLQLYGLLDYKVGYPGKAHKLYGKDCKLTDTLLWSKLLNADRYGGHSLEAWGKRLGKLKQDFSDFSQFSQTMLEYCQQDTAVNEELLYELLAEKAVHNWERAYSVEVKLADLTLKQEHFGFHFNQKKAYKNLDELGKMMQEISDKVNPLLPMKEMTQVELKNYTLPKIKFKQNGEISAIFVKFLQKHNATLSEDQTTILYEDKEYPIATTDALKTHKIASVDDIDVVKSYLLSLGWTPIEIKERDLVKKADKSQKTPEEISDTIARYVKQTEGSLFKELRLDTIGCSIENLEVYLRSKIDGNRPIYVPTNPRLTIGLEKEICPNLIALGEKADFVQDVVHYFTYRHRRNSIAGGFVLDADEDDEPTTGFLSCVRVDGRIPTPADTLGANTGRYRHKIVCNVPRNTSLYGQEMRDLFECGKGLYQLGYDFASLEARIMGHYVIPYKDGQALAEALVAVKPNDIHSLNAAKLGIKRDYAKSVSYAIMYGAQPKKLAKMIGVSEHEAKEIFNNYWEAVPALKELKDKLEDSWKKNGKKYIVGLDGRKLFTRSQHSLLNVLFQSGGAVTAKWSAVYLAERLEEKGILGDPFMHTIAEPKVWWMIHMHDEQQFAVHPSLMKIKNFPDDEAAKAAMQPGCSAIGHGSKGVYMAFETEPTKCITEAIAQANVDMKLRVQIGHEWVTGLSWGMCH